MDEDNNIFQSSLMRCTLYIGGVKVLQKVLIVEDNIIQSKQIINYIFKHNEDIKLYHIAYTYKDAINIIKKQAVDIILLDLKLPDMSRYRNY